MPLRHRLVLGFSLAMSAVLLAAGGFVYWRVELALDRSLDRELGDATSALAPLVTPAGRVTDSSAVAAAGVAYQVLDEDGRVLTGSVTEPLLDPADARASDDGPVRSDRGALLPASPDPLRLEVSRLPAAAGPATYLVVAARRDQRDEALRELLLQLLVAGIGALVVTAFVGDRLARAALRPVEDYRSRAAEIAAGSTGVRLDVPPDRDDEVTRLGHTLNDMLAALEAAIARERRFVDDASHELRTPLTLLTSRIQLARRRSRSVAEHEAVLAELETDVRRLATLAEQLLELGAAGTGPAATADLAAAAQDAVRRHAGEGVTGRVPGGVVPVPMSALALDRLLDNLLGNALLHGAPPVTVEVDAADGWARLRVADAGPGMGPELLATATERFTRADDARSRPGAGLGLALVEALVLDAGGRLRLCAHGTHQRVGPDAGPDAGVPCDHDDRMTVTVLLPPVSP
ncbi:HAMP domain-containing protein [Nocardioides guangzhouensis]|uniref:histidine kinase n=1 Tax=Nocardioides guangzhouensis TaxID=2497878 RepID=A0A4Q4Z2G0_9ACTN|nr:ATP-binding protein [Nocardioides guangzhouensis]RYP81518.1 HAMP domain-containing protein [Nocardioides guangzhouensis]